MITRVITGRWPVELQEDPVIPPDVITSVAVVEGDAWGSLSGEDDGRTYPVRAHVAFEGEALTGGKIIDGPDGWELRVIYWDLTPVDARDAVPPDARLRVGALVREIVEAGS